MCNYNYVTFNAKPLLHKYPDLLVEIADMSKWIFFISLLKSYLFSKLWPQFGVSLLDRGTSKFWRVKFCIQGIIYHIS